MKPKIDQRIANGDATRRKILDAAIRMGSRKGFASITVGTLAAKCGISKSGMFTHFATREALIIATLDAAYEEFADEVLAACWKAPPPDRVRLFLREYFRYVQKRSHRGVCILTSAAFEFDGADKATRGKALELIERRRSEMQRFVQDALDAGMSIGANEDVEQATFMLESLLVGFVYRYQFDPSPVFFDRLAKGLRDIFPSTSIRKPSPAPPVKRVSQSPGRAGAKRAG